MRSMKPGTAIDRAEVRRWYPARVIENNGPGREALFLGFLLILLQTADGILTSMGVSRFGLSVEGNPLLRLLMEEVGHVPALALLKLSAVVVVVGLVFLTSRLPWIRSALGAVSCIYLFAAIIPWTYILFFQV